MEDVNVQLSPELLPLESQDAAGALTPQFIAVPGQLRSIAGQYGPDILLAVAAALNGVQVSYTPGSNIITLGLTGIGTMAQRNAVGAVADVATADATDLATAITLVNDLKAKLNQLLAAMRTANHLTP